MGAAIHFAPVVYADGRDCLAAELGDLSCRGEPGEDHEAVVQRLNNRIRSAADDAGWRLAAMPQWRYADGMVARSGRVPVGPFERKRRPNGAHDEPGFREINFPDLLHPGTVGWVASMLRQAVPRYVCLPVFEDGEFRAFIVRNALGEDSDLLARHPIEGVALAMALVDVWSLTSVLRRHLDNKENT